MFYTLVNPGLGVHCMQSYYAECHRCDDDDLLFILNQTLT